MLWLSCRSYREDFVPDTPLCLLQPRAVHVVRLAILLFAAATAAVVGERSYEVLRRFEVERFEEHFREVVLDMEFSLEEGLSHAVESALDIRDSFPLPSVRDFNGTKPFAAFEASVTRKLRLGHCHVAGIAAAVAPDERQGFDAWARSHATFDFSAGNVAVPPEAELLAKVRKVCLKIPEACGIKAAMLSCFDHSEQARFVAGISDVAYRLSANGSLSTNEYVPASSELLEGEPEGPKLFLAVVQARHLRQRTPMEHCDVHIILCGW